MDYLKNYSDADAAREVAAYERECNARDARDLADFHAGDTPALNAFLDETTPDAPQGAYVMESDIDQATRRAPVTGWAAYLELIRADEAARVAARDALRVDFGHELSTLATITARFGKRVA